MVKINELNLYVIENLLDKLLLSLCINLKKYFLCAISFVYEIVINAWRLFLTHWRDVVSDMYPL